MWVRLGIWSFLCSVIKNKNLKGGLYIFVFSGTGVAAELLYTFVKTKSTQYCKKKKF